MCVIHVAAVNGSSRVVAVTTAPGETIRLAPLDEALLADLLDAARRGAPPEEVMPPVQELGWTDRNRTAFLDFYRPHLAGLDGPKGTVMFAILAEGAVAGMIRLARTAEPTVYETGMWLGRAYRGQGLGTAAVRALLARAAAVGATAVVADTTPGNVAALGALRRCGAVLTPRDGKVYAELAIPA